MNKIIKLFNWAIEPVTSYGGKNGAYKSALKILKLNPQKEIDGFDFEDVLPWDVIENEPEKLKLQKEYQRLNRRGCLNV